MILTSFTQHEKELNSSTHPRFHSPVSKPPPNPIIKVSKQQSVNCAILFYKCMYSLSKNAKRKKLDTGQRASQDPGTETNPNKSISHAHCVRCKTPQSRKRQTMKRMKKKHIPQRFAKSKHQNPSPLQRQRLCPPIPIHQRRNQIPLLPIRILLRRPTPNLPDQQTPQILLTHNRLQTPSPHPRPRLPPAPLHQPFNLQPIR